jgi:hypothetical protein
MVRMYRDYRGFLLVPVDRRIYSLLGYMLDNALLGHLGDRSDCQYDSESEKGTYPDLWIRLQCLDVI